MIIVKLFGGLGNQMFQYAAARRLALQHGTDVRLDLRWFGTQTTRELALLNLAVRAAPAPADLLLRGFPDEWTGSGRRSRLRARMAARRQGQVLLAESRPGVFQPALLTAPDAATLVGYWQSEKYFVDVAQELREEFSSPRPPSPRDASIRAEIEQTGGVSLHVRRGDFAHDASASAHGLSSPDFYRRAMSLVDDELGSPVYYGFSDDPDWVLENIRHPRLRMVASADRTAQAHDDLALMAACRGHIVANSTFSWWGAWLGSAPDKLVVAPRQWFADARLSSRDIVPASWRQV